MLSEFKEYRALLAVKKSIQDVSEVLDLLDATSGTDERLEDVPEVVVTAEPAVDLAPTTAANLPDSLEGSFELECSRPEPKVRPETAPFPQSSETTQPREAAQSANVVSNKSQNEEPVHKVASRKTLGIC